MRARRVNEPRGSYETIRVEPDGPLTWIVLDRPAKRNAMNPQMLQELASAVTVLGADESVRTIGIRGAGPSFCSGYDIGRSYASALSDRDSFEEWADLRTRMDRMMTIWDCPVPVVAAVHGYCLAGATQLCTFCDLVIVADDAIVGSPGVSIGAGYVSPMYVLTVGMRRAKELGMVPGRQITGPQAVDWGWANWSVGRSALEAEVRDLARRFAMVPRAIVTANKIAMNRIAELNGFRHAIGQLADIDVIAHRSAAAGAAAKRLSDEGPGKLARDSANNQGTENGGTTDEIRNL
jgi:enoyl-CoA hydratase